MCIKPFAMTFAVYEYISSAIDKPISQVKIKIYLRKNSWDTW